ncbi:MAG: diguanylate cyclase [Desulfomonile tiedjei]|uniref:Diguanylate cyclase n=1 Tax=Desulfomonile tiedjei TaxID=2358 RepID=A0A9D6Z3U6_9BACT|nr:diguanylate cyclase [Desulfomonile tiedjei]
MEKKDLHDFFFTENDDLDLLEDHIASQTIDLRALSLENLNEQESPELREYDKTPLGKLLNSLPMPAMLLATTGIILFANEGCSRISSDKDKLKGETFSRLFSGSNRSEKALDLFQRVLSERQSQVGHTHLGLDTHKIFGRIHFRSVRAWNERLILFVIEDLTAEKKQILLAQKHHELARQARDELELRVQQRTAELMETNKKLRREIAHRKRVEIQLRSSENKYRAIFETAPVAIIEEDLSGVKADLQALQAEGVRDLRQYIGNHPELVVKAACTSRIVDVNNATLKLYGASDKTDLIGTLDKMMVPDSLDILKEKMLALAEGYTSLETEMVGRNLHGEQIYLLVRASLPPDMSRTKRAIVTKLDITELKRAQEALARSKREWERTFDAVPDLISIIDREQRIVRVNKALADRLGALPQELVGRRCYETFHLEERGPENCPHLMLMADGLPHLSEVVDERLGGTFVVSTTPLLDDDGNLAGSVHVARDITERKRLEEELKILATRDSLTGLLNRRHFMESLGFFFENAKRYALPLSLCLCDLDSFKQINDVYGHQAGDKVLEAFGEVLRHELRSSDVAARYGGDEFVVIFPHTNSSEARECLERIRVHLESTVFRNEAESYKVTCTAGVGEFRAHMHNAEELVQEADKALYKGKALGRNCVVMFRPE